MSTIKSAVLEAQVKVTTLRSAVAAGMKGKELERALAAVAAVEKSLISVMKHVKKRSDPANTGRTHELKTAVSPFMAVRRGEKTFEIRVNDRGFQAGDILKLWCFDEEMYTGHWVAVLVTYVIDLRPFITAAEGDFVGMSIDIIDHGYDGEHDDNPIPF